MTSTSSQLEAERDQDGSTPEGAVMTTPEPRRPAIYRATKLGTVFWTSVGISTLFVVWATAFTDNLNTITTSLPSYGAKDGTLVLGGERLELVDLTTGRQLSPPMTDELRGSGRGVIAADGIYVPGQDKLRRVNWDGTWDEASSKRWPGGIGDGGNLIIVDGAAVLASQDAIQVYFDRRDQERTILEALERNPDDPAVLYRGALRFLQSGDPSRAAQLLVRTVARTEKSPRAEDERLQRAARKRLFAVSMEAGRTELEAGRWFSRQEALQMLEGTHPDNLFCPPHMAIANTLLKAWALEGERAV